MESTNDLIRKRNLIPSVENMELVGGRLCLDFVNTLNRERGHAVDERFQTFRDVLTWSVRLGLIEKPAAGKLEAICDRHPRKAELALKGVHELRAGLWNVFAAPQPEGLGQLHAATRQLSMPRLKLVDGGNVFLEPGRDLTGWLFVSIFGSAIELLTTADPARIKVCPGHRCGWLFIDESPGNRRKWCSMKACGNRQKAREHYRRVRARS